MNTNINTQYRKPLPGTQLDYFDAREAVNAISPGAYETLPYTSRVLAEQLVRRCDPNTLTDSLKQLIERKRDLDFPWYPARVVCHDILGQTALVDLAGRCARIFTTLTTWTSTGLAVSICRRPWRPESRTRRG